MKVFIAIICLAFVACTCSADDPPPHSMVGNLWRYKSGIANNMGDMSDRMIDRIRNLSPFRLLNFNVGLSTASKPTSAQKPAAVQAPVPTAAAPVKPPPNPKTVMSPTTSKPVNCTIKGILMKKLQLAQKHENEAATALANYMDDDKASTEALAKDPKDTDNLEFQKEIKMSILIEQTKNESAHLLVNDLLKKLEAYKSCP